MKIQIEQATPDKASHIASLIMEAMRMRSVVKILLVLSIHWLIFTV